MHSMPCGSTSTSASTAASTLATAASTNAATAASATPRRSLSSVDNGVAINSRSGASWRTDYGSSSVCSISPAEGEAEAAAGLSCYVDRHMITTEMSREIGFYKVVPRRQYKRLQSCNRILAPQMGNEGHTGHHSDDRGAQLPSTALKWAAHTPRAPTDRRERFRGTCELRTPIALASCGTCFSLSFRAACSALSVGAVAVAEAAELSLVLSLFCLSALHVARAASPLLLRARTLPSSLVVGVPPVLARATHTIRVRAGVTYLEADPRESDFFGGFFCLRARHALFVRSLSACVRSNHVSIAVSFGPGGRVSLHYHWVSSRSTPLAS